MTIIIGQFHSVWRRNCSPICFSFSRSHFQTCQRLNCLQSIWCNWSAHQHGFRDDILCPPASVGLLFPMWIIKIACQHSQVVFFSSWPRIVYLPCSFFSRRATSLTKKAPVHVLALFEAIKWRHRDFKEIYRKKKNILWNMSTQQWQLVSCLATWQP